MSLIKEYSMIVPEEELAEWTNKGCMCERRKWYS